MRIRRILQGSAREDTDASVRSDFYQMCGGGALPHTLLALPHRVLDSAYMSPGSLRALLDAGQTEYAEAVAQRRHTEAWRGSTDVPYDAVLTRLLGSTKTRDARIVWSERHRLAASKMHLKTLIRDRMAELEQVWARKHPEQPEVSDAGSTAAAAADLAELHSTSQRVAALVAQLVTKELPMALADVAKRVPASSHLAFYERPTIAMKSARAGSANGGAANGSTRKRAKPHAAKSAPSKGPPRPILPAGGARNPSSESISAAAHESTSCAALEESMLLAMAQVAEKKHDPHASESPLACINPAQSAVSLEEHRPAVAI